MDLFWAGGSFLDSLGAEVFRGFLVLVELQIFLHALVLLTLLHFRTLFLLAVQIILGYFLPHLHFLLSYLHDIVLCPEFRNLA